MFTLKPIAVVCVSMLTVVPAALAQAPQFGQPIAPRHRSVGHQHRTGWSRSAAWSWHRNRGGSHLCSEMSGLSRREGNQPQCRARWSACRRHGHTGAGQNTDKDCGKFLALCNNAVRLHPPRNAIPRVEIAHRGRTLRGIGLYPQSQRDRRIERCDRRAVAAQRENAEPGRVHPVPAQSEVRGRTLVHTWPIATNPIWPLYVGEEGHSSRYLLSRSSSLFASYRTEDRANRTNGWCD